MKKTFNFGKIDYLETGRKINAVTIEVELKEGSLLTRDFDTLEVLVKPPVFSASVNIWNNRRTDIIAGGQCFDELEKYAELNENPIFKQIYRIWFKYHLNDLKAGTKKQMDFLNPQLSPLREKCPQLVNDYELICDFLKEHNLYEDRNYKYGTAWLTEQIPSETIKEIETLLQS